jgi:hypothetical protein
MGFGTKGVMRNRGTPAQDHDSDIPAGGTGEMAEARLLLELAGEAALLLWGLHTV